MVDNVDPAVLKTLVTDMSKTVERHETGKKIFDAIGDVGPAMGMIGTLIGWFKCRKHVGSIDHRSIYGRRTFDHPLRSYAGHDGGFPIADKLELRSQQERDAKLLLIDAISGIQQGLHPRILQQILMVHLPGSLRVTEEDDE